MRRLGIVAALVLLASVPLWVGSTYYVNISSQILFYAIFALGVNVLAGYAGLVSLGHAGLFGIAAYSGAKILNDGHGHVAVVAGALALTLAASAVFAVLALRGTGLGFPTYRLAISLIAVVFAVALWALLDRTRLGAMIRAGVDDPAMARVVGIRVSRLFTIVFCLGAWLAGFAGVIGGPILSVYPGLDQDMLPLALVVVILGGSGSLLGSFVGSFVVGVLYNFGQALVPEFAYVVLFLPMLVVLVVRPAGLFGRPSS